MRVRSVEPTPNPNNMKILVDEALPDGVSYNVTPQSLAGAPEHLRRVVMVPGVRGAYQVADFIAVERSPKIAWATVLAGVRAALEEGVIGADAQAVAASEPLGEIQVFVQMFRGLPMQVKLQAGLEQMRFALPERFKVASMKAAEAVGDVVHERRWVQHSIRYGDLADVGPEIVREIDAAYGEERLQRLLEQAVGLGPGEAAPDDNLPPAEVLQRLESPDWKERYAALDRFEPTAEALTVLEKALADPHPQVRRLAVVYLGAVEGANILPYLLTALKDPIVAVRRAAGDGLSDLGDPSAAAAMCDALKDPSKLVRWRAARFLYEVGDEPALPALRAAADDPEFEVALQVRIAIERIEGGKPTTAPVWRLMTEAVERKQ